MDMDDDGERFVARRGQQGDDWHWETPAPGTPAPDTHAPGEGAANSRLASGLRDALRSSSAKATSVLAWAVSALKPLTGLLKRFFEPARPGRPRKSQAAADILATPDEPSIPRQSYTPPVSPRPKIAIPWSRLALPRPRLVRESRPPLPATAKPRWKAPAFRRPGGIAMPMSRDTQEGIALFAGLALATVLAVSAVLAVIAFDNGDDGSGGIVGEVSQTPKPTRSAGGGGGDDSPTPTEEPDKTVEPTDTPGPSRTPRATATPVVTPSPGSPAFAFWGNNVREWVFDDLTGDNADYEEGEYIPFMVRWGGTAGQQYELHFVYDCMTDDAFGAFDYLSGLDAVGRDPVFAKDGPAKDLPDAAVPVPDTPDFPVDDANAGVLSLYGGTFVTLPSAPWPEENCSGQRSIDLVIQANGGPVYLIGSGHLALASVWGTDEGASSNDPPFGMRISLEGVGEAGHNVQASAIADIEH